MIKKLKQIFNIDTFTTSPRVRSYAHVYTPEQPLGFVRRSDPNFYFLSKR